MAKIRIKGLSQVVNNIEKKLKGARINKSAQNFMCDLIETDTQQTIRDGRNPNTKNTAKIKKLKPSTIESRKRLAKKLNMHPDFSPKRSNLTLTGKLIDSITCKFRRLKRGVGFSLKGTGENRNGVPNSDIFEYQKALGRDVLGVRNKAKRAIIKILKELYIDTLK